MTTPKLDLLGIFWKVFADNWQLSIFIVVMMGLTFSLALWQRFKLGIKNSPMSLEEALSLGEGQGIEFKNGIPEKILARSIAAFANTNPGTIFLGVDDHARVVGIPAGTAKEKDDVLKRIRNFTANEIDPPIIPECDFISHGEKIVLRIFVPRGRHPLYMVDGVTYVRHMNSSTKAGPERIKEMFRQYFNRHEGAEAE